MKNLILLLLFLFLVSPVFAQDDFSEVPLPHDWSGSISSDTFLSDGLLSFDLYSDYYKDLRTSDGIKAESALNCDRMAILQRCDIFQMLRTFVTYQSERMYDLQKIAQTCLNYVFFIFIVACLMLGSVLFLSYSQKA